MPTHELIEAMTAFNEALLEAGVLVTGEGLHPSSAGRRLVRRGEALTVEHGPWSPPRDLVAGFWIWEVASMDEAESWARRCPPPMPGDESVLEIRPIYGPEDFGDAMTPEQHAREDAMRRALESSASGSTAAGSTGVASASTAPTGAASASTAPTRAASASSPPLTVYPCYWFASDAASASALYRRLMPTEGDSDGTRNALAMTHELRVGGGRVLLLEAGPAFAPTPALSNVVGFSDAAALNRAWAELVEGGKVYLPLQAWPWSERYGWCEDRWGVGWQLTLESRSAPTGDFMAPCLLFTGDNVGRAKEALALYERVFGDAELNSLTEQPDDSGRTVVAHACLRIGDASVWLMENTMGPGHPLTCGTSLVVECRSQAELDRIWEGLSADPSAEACGWLKDRFGVSWQVIPAELLGWMSDAVRGPRVMDALRGMTRPDIAALRAIAEG